MSLVSSKSVGENRMELTVEVKGDPFKKAVDRAFQKNAKKIALPGFRRGKAPRAMIEKVYGKGLFYEEALNDLYPNAYKEAVEVSGIDPVDAADVEMLEVGDDGIVFKATVTTRPVAELGEYIGLEAARPVKQVTDEEISAHLLEMQKKSARTIAVTARPAKKGDIVDINFEGYVDGAAFEGGKAENFPLTLGSGSFIPGFEDQIEGKGTSEEFDVNVTFPEEYGEASLAGKPAVFKVKINDIKEQQLPEIDDEFAKDISEFDNLQAYKDDMRNKLNVRYESDAAAEFENCLIDKVIDNMKVTVPECMIIERMEELVKDFASRLSQQGLNLEDFIKYTGENKEKFKESFRPQSERQVKARLAMEAIAKKEALDATAEELEQEYQKMAEVFKTELEKVKIVFPEKELKMDVACRKALAFIAEKAKVVEEIPAQAASEYKAVEKNVESAE